MSLSMLYTKCAIMLHSWISLSFIFWICKVENVKIKIWGFKKRHLLKYDTFTTVDRSQCSKRMTLRRNWGQEKLRVSVRRIHSHRVALLREHRCLNYPLISLFSENNSQVILYSWSTDTNKRPIQRLKTRVNFQSLWMFQIRKSLLDPSALISTTL